jgi:hypothetical protein
LFQTDQTDPPDMTDCPLSRRDANRQPRSNAFVIIMRNFLLAEADFAGLLTFVGQISVATRQIAAAKSKIYPI